MRSLQLNKWNFADGEYSTDRCKRIDSQFTMTINDPNFHPRTLSEAAEENIIET